jgi:uncharacterized protein (UPF0212 family)
MHDQIVISIRDLRLVTIGCPHCNTKVTLDLDMEFQPPRSPFLALTECPRCGSPFDSAIPGAIQGLYKIYTALAKLRNAVTFTRNAAELPASEGKTAP